MGTARDPLATLGALAPLLRSVAAGERRRLAVRLREAGPVDWGAGERALVGEIVRSPGDAAALIQAFRRVATVSADPEARARAARIEGFRLGYLGKHAGALECYRLAETEFAAAGLATARDGARIGVAGALVRLGRFDEARRAAAVARRASLRRGEPAVAAAADTHAALAWHESGHPERALPLYRRAREEFVAAGQSAHAAVAAHDEANALALLDRFDEALVVLDEAIALLDPLGSTHEAARFALDRGELLLAMDRLGEADAALAAAEARFEAAGDPLHAAMARLGRGETLLLAGLAPEALHALGSAESVLRGMAPPAERDRARLLVARALIVAGRSGDARRLLARPLRVPTRSALATRAELLGRALAIDGKTAAALRRYEEAAAGHSRRRPAAAARVLAQAADVARARGDRRVASGWLRRARRALSRADLPSLRFAVEAVGFQLALDGNRRAVAARCLDRALEALDGVRAGLGRDALRSALLGGREAWIARAIRFSLDRSTPAAALAIAERFRARALLDLLGDSDRLAADGAEPTQDTGTAEMVARLRAELAALEAVVHDAPGHATPGMLRGRALPADAPAEIAALERRLAVAVDRGDLAPLLDVPSLDACRANLAAGDLVIALHTDDVGSLTFAVTREGVDAISSDACRDDVARVVEALEFRFSQFTLGQAFSERHARRLRRETDRLLGELSRLLFGPPGTLLHDRAAAARRIIVVPHGPWHRVPFAALPLADGRALVEGRTVARAPAVAALARRVRRARGAATVVGVGDELAPGMEAEAAAVAQALPGARLLLGEEARLAALRRTGGRAGAPSCLHVASHGRYRSDAPAMSAVRLADGWLRACDLRRLPLTGSLVVLSGCETGVSRIDAGDEVHGLVRGALAGGARALVASQWRVDDASTTDLMVRFHELRARRSADVALCAAQAEAAARGLHPWHWAGFACWLGAAPAR